jgi:hypothetical protein
VRSLGYVSFSLTIIVNRNDRLKKLPTLESRIGKMNLEMTDLEFKPVSNLNLLVATVDGNQQSQDEHK